MEIGTGTTIAFDSGFFAEVLDIKGPDASRKSIETSHMGTTTAHTFTPGDLVDWGEVTIDVAFRPGARPPIDHAKESCTITFPDTGAATWVFSAFMVRFSPSIPLEDRMTATCVLKVSGDVTVTA